MHKTALRIDDMAGTPTPKELANIKRKMTPILRSLERLYMDHPDYPTMKFNTLSGGYGNNHASGEIM